MLCRILIALIALASTTFADPATSDDGRVSLSNGIVQFTPPPDPWVVSWVSPKGEAAIYTLAGKGRIQIAAIPGFAPKNPQAEELTRGMLLDHLRGMRNQAMAKDPDLQMVKPLAIEKDDRFFVVLREQFRKDGKEFEQTHYYRNLASHQYLVSVVAHLDSQENVSSLRAEAEKVSLSGALVPKGQKAPPAPVLGAEVAAAKAAAVPTDATVSTETKPAAAKPDIAAAQKELETATANCEAELARDPKYKSAKSKADAAEAKLRELREQNPPDRAAISQASEEWLEAKRPVESMRQAALARDPAVIEARKKLAEARGKK